MLDFGRLGVLGIGDGQHAIRRPSGVANVVRSSISQSTPPPQLAGRRRTAVRPVRCRPGPRWSWADTRPRGPAAYAAAAGSRYPAECLQALGVLQDVPLVGKEMNAAGGRGVVDPGDVAVGRHVPGRLEAAVQPEGPAGRDDLAGDGEVLQIVAALVGHAHPRAGGGEGPGLGGEIGAQYRLRPRRPANGRWACWEILARPWPTQKAPNSVIESRYQLTKSSRARGEGALSGSMGRDLVERGVVRFPCPIQGGHVGVAAAHGTCGSWPRRSGRRPTSRHGCGTGRGC